MIPRPHPGPYPVPCPDRRPCPCSCSIPRPDHCLCPCPCPGPCRGPGPRLRPCCGPSARPRPSTTGGRLLLGGCYEKGQDSSCQRLFLGGSIVYKTGRCMLRTGHRWKRGRRSMLTIGPGWKCVAGRRLCTLPTSGLNRPWEEECTRGHFNNRSRMKTQCKEHSRFKNTLQLSPTRN